MKKILLLILFIGLFTSCKEDCTQDAYCQLVSSSSMRANINKTLEKVTVCHQTGNGSYQTIEIDEDDLQFHLDHGDNTGDCGTLSSDSLEFRDGEVVEIPCSYDLPFMHIKENGEQWYYSKPN